MGHRSLMPILPLQTQIDLLNSYLRDLADMRRNIDEQEIKTHKQIKKLEQRIEKAKQK